MRRALLLPLAVVAGCHHKLAPVIAEVRAHVSQVEPKDLPMLDDAALNAAVLRVVAAVPGPLKVALSPPADAPRLRLTVDISTGYREGKFGSALRARLEPIGDIAGVEVIDRDGLVEKEGQSKAPTAADVAAHVTHALDLVAGGVVRGEDLWLGTPERARAALGGSDGDLRDEAVRIAGERHDRLSVPMLVTMLKADDDALRDRVIGALGAIGDPRAAKALADRAKLGDLDEIPKIIDAISHVGGPEAESYLEFVASSHSVPEIREMAKRALEHLRARVDLSAPTSPLLNAP